MLFRHFYDSLGMKLCFASVDHLQPNRAIKRANGGISTAVAKQLVGLLKGKWAEELSKVLWSLHTTLTRPIDFTPFHLLFRDEVMTPEEA